MTDVRNLLSDMIKVSPGLPSDVMLVSTGGASPKHLIVRLQPNVAVAPMQKELVNPKIKS